MVQKYRFNCKLEIFTDVLMIIKLPFSKNDFYYKDFISNSSTQVSESKITHLPDVPQNIKKHFLILKNARPTQNTCKLMINSNIANTRRTAIT